MGIIEDNHFTIILTNNFMAYYTVFWPKDWVDEIKKAGDNGPIKVIFGSIHTRMPSVASIKVGDIVSLYL